MKSSAAKQPLFPIQEIPKNMLNMACNGLLSKLGPEENQ